VQLLHNPFNLFHGLGDLLCNKVKHMIQSDTGAMICNWHALFKEASARKYLAHGTTLQWPQELLCLR
jgi:hypothetical protein